MNYNYIKYDDVTKKKIGDKDNIIWGTRSWEDTNLGRDVIKGLGGNDKIYAKFGDDIIEAGKGNDLINGGWGNDVFYFAFQSGHDTIEQFGMDPDNNTDTIIVNGYYLAPTVASNGDVILRFSYDNNPETVEATVRLLGVTKDQWDGSAVIAWNMGENYQQNDLVRHVTSQLSEWDAALRLA